MKIDNLMFYELNIPVLIEGLDDKMQIIIYYSSKEVLSNGQLVDRTFYSSINIYGGPVTISQNMIEYKKSNSIFELLFSHQ